MLWLAHHNFEINWKMEEVKMTRCLDKYKKQQNTRQTKPGQQKQKEKEQKREKIQKKKKKEFRKLTVKEEIEIAGMIEEKKEDLIEIRTVEEMVPRRFYKYLKVFEKKELEKMPTKKT